MGVGDPLEAAYHSLSGPIAAGRWHLVGDGIVLAPVDMRFDVVWRSAAGDQIVASFTHHYDPSPTSDAVAFDGDASAMAVAAKDGDALVLRMTAAASGDPGAAWIPNADGPHAHGRIPSLTLPP